MAHTTDIAALPVATDEQAREYHRAYDSVMAAARAGYHQPYNNLHDDDALGDAYERGFCDAVEAVRVMERAA